MANATAITLHKLDVETAKSDVTADVLDTGTAAVTLAFYPDGDTHNVLLVFENTSSTDSMTVDVLAGDKAPAFLRTLGNVSITVAKSSTAYVVVDSARCKNADGSIKVKSTPASGQSQTLKITAIQLPK